MAKKSDLRLRWWYPLAAVALLVMLSLSARDVLAGGSKGVTGARSELQVGADHQSSPPQSNVSQDRQSSANVPHTADAFLTLVPDTTTLGTCPAPANGGVTQLGCAFVLDLILNTGSNPDATAQQSYLTFTYQTIQNARVSTINTSCVPTSTVTPDLNTFDAVLQNEVCNGPNACVFRGLAVTPGLLSYASGALSNCPTGCGGVFRVAQVGICASNPGQAILHWQFTPPAPLTRDTEIIAFTNELIQNASLFADYTFTITGGTPTSTPSSTHTNTPLPTSTGTSTSIVTATSTSTVVTTTHTRTPTPGVTGTPCDRCQAEVKDVTLACISDGTLYWSAVVKNNGQCTLTVPYRVTLQAKTRPPHSRWVNVDAQRGNVSIPPRSQVVVFGTFCYPFPGNIDRLRAEFALDGTTHECMKKEKSHEIRPCGNTPTCQLGFPDVPVSNPYYLQISGLISNGVITGYGDGTFRPDASVNRGQLAKMIVLAYGLTPNGDIIGHFTDVPANNPYYSYVETAYSLGVVSGYRDGSFHLYSNVTRAQLAKMVVQALGLTITNPTKASFTDVATNSTFYRYIETANANGLLTGDEDGTFKPGALVSRGEAAQVLDQSR